jgi:hypothetical protein
VTGTRDDVPASAYARLFDRATGGQSPFYIPC